MFDPKDRSTWEQDTDFKIDGKWVLQWKMGEKVKHSRLGMAYNGMLRRTKAGGRYQRDRPTYVGVTLDPGWKDPQVFCEWAVVQPGWGLGWELDKDLLNPTAKAYGPDTCTFLPGVLNTTIQDVGATGTYKNGSQWTAKMGRIYLGLFKTKEEATARYREFKELYVQMLADKYRANLHPLAYQRLLEWRA